jgi:hypothetical protein
MFRVLGYWRVGGPVDAAPEAVAAATPVDCPTAGAGDTSPILTKNESIACSNFGSRVARRGVRG